MEGATTFCEDHKDIVGCEYKVIQVKVVWTSHAPPSGGFCLCVV
jgi:hypothetical protein